MKNRRSRRLLIPLVLLLVLTMAVPGAASAAGTLNGSANDRRQAGEAAHPFLDVDAGQWYAAAVQYVFDRSLMKGVSDTAFDPDSTVSRGMAVTVLYRMEQQPEINESQPFPDVEEGRFFRDAVCWAASGSIVEGYDNGNFGPFDEITREQLAKILYRYAGKMEYELGEPADSLENFTDSSSVSGWAQDGMKWAVGAGLIRGDGGRLLPKDSLSRKELAQILQRADEKIGAQKDPAGDSGQYVSEDGTFADNMAALMPQDKNWAVSPYSLEMCMAMFTNGTKGATREEFLDVLRIRDLDAYNRAAAKLLQKYDSYNEVMNLETANSIWLNQSEFEGRGQFLESFSGTLRDYYRADAREVTRMNSIESINAWAKEKTHDLIERIAEEDNRDFATAVANALYFKAAWSLPFDKQHTQDRIFHNYNDSETLVPFMYQRDYFGYYSNDGVRAVKLNYSNRNLDPKTGTVISECRDADFSMYIVMSDQDIDMQSFLDTAEFRSTKMDLRIPKFKIEFGGPMDHELQTLGIQTAYDPILADLTGMVDPAILKQRNLYLDSTVHKVYISVDEAGTEAAAVTVMFTKRNTTAIDTNPVVDFTADRPFRFAIRDNASGKILFTGEYRQASE